MMLMPAAVIDFESFFNWQTAPTGLGLGLGLFGYLHLTNCLLVKVNDLGKAITYIISLGLGLISLSPLLLSAVITQK